MGDVFCSLNPVFGQGMTVALEQALLLQQGLGRGRFSSRDFHRHSARRARLPFLLSKVGSDTEDGFSKRYLQRFLLRCQKSTRLHKNFLKVLHLKTSYSSLFDLPSLMASLHSGGSHD